MIRQRKQQPNLLPLVHDASANGASINGSKASVAFPGITSRRIKRRGSSKDAVLSYMPYFIVAFLALGGVGWYFMSTKQQAFNHGHNHHRHQQHGHHSHRRVEPGDIHDQFAEYKQAREKYDKTLPKRYHPGAPVHQHLTDKLQRPEDAGGRPRRRNKGIIDDSDEIAHRPRKAKGELADGRTQEDAVKPKVNAGVVKDDMKVESNNAGRNTRRALGVESAPVDAKTEAPVLVKCSDGSQGFLNDDFCDCPDGSDETETSACSHLTIQKAVFRCKGDSNMVIFASRVGDGVRDCPDGSDELSTTISNS